MNTLTRLWSHYDIRLKRRYADSLDYQRARNLAWVHLGLLAVTISYSLLLMLTGRLDAFVLASAFAGLLMGAVDLALIAGGRATMTGWVFSLFVYGVALSIVITQGLNTPFIAVMALVPVISSALIGRNGLQAFSFLALASIPVGGYVHLAYIADPASTAALREPFFAAAIFLITLILFADIVFTLFLGNLRGIVQRSQRTAGSLRLMARVLQSTTRILDLDRLLRETVQLIRDQFDLYHAQIFLIDEAGQYALLVASTGTAGEQLLARGHRLAVGSTSVIGRVTQSGQVVYATDTSANPIHRRNEFLPATRAELALPLRDGKAVIGALDVQSTRPNAFSDEDIEVLQILADQISIAIRNVRLFEQTRDTLDQSQQLYEEAQTHLRENVLLNQQLTGQAWEHYVLQADDELAVQISGGRMERQAEWTPTLAEAAQTGVPLLRQERGQMVLAVPVMLRNTVIGAVEVTLPGGINADDARVMVETVADRLATTIDTNRLYEEAQTRARQERLISDIGGQLQTTGSVEEMLNLVLTELTQALGAETAAVRLSRSDGRSESAVSNGRSEQVAL